MVRSVKNHFCHHLQRIKVRDKVKALNYLIIDSRSFVALPYSENELSQSNHNAQIQLKTKRNRIACENKDLDVLIAF